MKVIHIDENTTIPLKYLTATCALFVVMIGGFYVIKSQASDARRESAETRAELYALKTERAQSIIIYNANMLGLKSDIGRLEGKVDALILMRTK